MAFICCFPQTFTMPQVGREEERSFLLIRNLIRNLFWTRCVRCEPLTRLDWSIFAQGQVQVERF